MRCRLWSAVMVLWIGVCYLNAQDNSPSPRVLKSENGLIISWASSTDPQTPQVEISDEQGHVVTRLNVLQPAREADRVSIYDVSANSHIVAVAAVYRSKQGNLLVRPASTLLIFDSSGKLLSALALAPSHEIRLLALDDHSNIWTLTHFSDTNANPSLLPMVVEYSPSGEILREMLPRNLFPLHQNETQESMENGPPVMGHDSGIIWFWLPGSTDLVTISAADGKVNRRQTQLPKSTTGRTMVPLRVVRDPSGDVLARIREDDPQMVVEPKPAFYRWSISSGSWSRSTPTQCEPSIVGLWAGGMFVRKGTDRANICVVASK